MYVTLPILTLYVLRHLLLPRYVTRLDSGIGRRELQFIDVGL